MNPTADDVRDLVRRTPTLWRSLHLVHRTAHDEVEAWLRHGELEAVRRTDGSRFVDHGAPPTSWEVRPIEPIYESYQWAAMLDPYELSEGVAITDVREDRLFDRPVWRFRAQAEEEYDPICSCCPLVFSEVSQRIEYGDDWVASPDAVIPVATELALDVATGIVVSSHEVEGRPTMWFQNGLLSAD